MTYTIENRLDRIEQALGEDDGNPIGVLDRCIAFTRCLGG
jgi:hypothetical protein